MKTLYALLTSLWVLTSCEKIWFEGALQSQDPFTNFDHLWQTCRDKYSYFDLKKIDWDQVRIQYRAQLQHGMSQEALFNVLGGMLSELKDDHTNLKSNFNRSRFGVVYTAQDNFDWRIVVDHYLTPNYVITGPFQHDFINGLNIGYIRFSSFTGTMNKQHLDFILTRYQESAGLILDIRENGGGDMEDIFTLLSRFIEKKTLLYYSKIKAGPGKNDFSEAEPVYLNPHSGIRFGKKVVLLTDRGTYSAGSFTALATQAIPNVTRIGYTTGGGLGVPVGGQLPNGWRYRFSITQTLSLDKKPDYEQGVPPDITVQLDWNALTQDEILDRAIYFLTQQE